MMRTFKEERRSIPGMNNSRKTLLNKKRGNDTNNTELMIIDENVSIQIGSNRRHRNRNNKIPR
jgi:hypothetical protein